MDYSNLNGPGEHLLNGIYMGDTIARQSFKTLLVFDISMALNMTVDRLFVVDISQGNVHYTWSSRYVIVTLRMFGPERTVNRTGYFAPKFGIADPVWPTDYIACKPGDPECRPTSGGGDYNKRKNIYLNYLWQGPEQPTTRAVMELTEQAQQSSSPLYKGDVTRSTDPLWGVVCIDWDISLRLAYSIVAVGQSLVKTANTNNDQTTQYLNHGGDRYCADTTAEIDAKWRGTVERMDGVVKGDGRGKFPFGNWGDSGSNGIEKKKMKDTGFGEIFYDVNRYNQTTNSTNRTAYCEFEMFFIDDISRALNVSTKRLDILFVKAASLDNVLVYFRIYPPMVDGELSSAHIQNELFRQTQNLTSDLFKGNVTIRVDPVYAVSSWERTTDQIGDRRYESFFLTYKQMPTSVYAYERCKFTHRCARAYEHYDQHKAALYFTAKVHDGGVNDPAALFTDFEDWRVGTKGWSHRGFDTVPRDGLPRLRKPNGAHFAPFNFTMLGPSVATHAPLGRVDEPARGAERPSEGGGQTDEHIAYEAQNQFINSGLVLNAAQKAEQIEAQNRLLNSIQKDIDFSLKYKTSAIMDAKLRARLDVQRLMQTRLDWLEARLDFENEIYRNLSRSQCWNRTCELLFNTSSLELTGTITDTGVIAKTKKGTEVAVFAFDSIELGPEVKVTLAGQRALCLLSRSSIFINTTFYAEPGTIGGFPGGYSWGRNVSDLLSDAPEDQHLNKLKQRSAMHHKTKTGTSSYWASSGTHQMDSGIPSNNVNGPGSGNVRVYLQTVTTSATDIDEVQTITTTADDEQTLGGGFRLHYAGYTTRYIPHDATARTVKSAIEEGLNSNSVEELWQINRVSVVPGVGIVNVTRSAPDSQEGYVWSITFSSAIGDVPLLGITNLLTGLGAHADVDTTIEGNSLSGTFNLTFLGQTTRQLAHDVHPEDLKLILEEDFNNTVLRAHVERNDPTRGLCTDSRCPNGPWPTFSRCSDGLCNDGPFHSGGFTWTVTLTTQTGNVAPWSPTHEIAYLEGTHRPLTTGYDGTLLGIGATVTIIQGHGESQYDRMAALKATIPFSLAYGGGGAGHGGEGGDGYADNFGSGTTGLQYNDDGLSKDLTGGSGGQMGYILPFAQHAFSDPTGRGGNGGGAIELVAVNDIRIGILGILNVSAGDGEAGHVSGGGGGSGGSILIATGGVIKVEGQLLAAGGDGGLANDDLAPSRAVGQSHSLPVEMKDSAGGGGGGGGRIALFAQSYVKEKSAILDISGGKCRAWSDSFVRDVELERRYAYPTWNVTQSYTGIGWCYGGVNDALGSTPSEYQCWENCHAKYSSNLVAINWDHREERCYCQDSCECMAEVGDESIILLVDRRATLPDECAYSYSFNDDSQASSSTRRRLSQANPTGTPTLLPTLSPTSSPSLVPTGVPTGVPTLEPSPMPTKSYKYDGGISNDTYWTYPNMNFTTKMCGRHGKDGSLRVETQFGLRYSIDDTRGVFGTLKSLKIESDERITTASNVTRRGPFTFNGPEYNVAFQCEGEAEGSKHKTPHDVANAYTCKRAERVTYFTYLESTDTDSKMKAGSWGAMFVIWPEQYAGTGGLNGSTWDGVENDTSVMIGIQMTDAFRHGADFNFEPGVLEYFKHLPKFEDFVQLDRWYKVDISIDWNQHIYDVRLDDVPVVDDAPFNTDHNTIARVGLYNYHQTTVWFDEIFVGRDDTMGFNTPKVAYDGVEMDRPWQTGWTDAEIGDRDRYEYMTRHGNHVLLRERYQRSDGGGLVPYDGKGYRSYISDIAQRFETGDHRPRQGGLYAGALVYLDSSLGRYIPDDIGRIAVNRDTRNFEKQPAGPWGDGSSSRYFDKQQTINSPAPETDQPWTFGNPGDGLQTITGKTDSGVGKSGIWYWYGEHNKPGGSFGEGAVVCASTDDLQTWRNEGIMLHYENITDMVSGKDGPFIVERPKVVYNDMTGRYVMWFVIDDEAQSLGMAGIAVSDYPNGPFDFVRSFYPDGNQTRDQIVWNVGNEGFLGRTYYNDVEFVLPEPIMQPWWSLVKVGNVTDFALSYHRTFYSSDYDNFHDIFKQVWRKEHIIWEVTCRNRITLEERTIYADTTRSFDEPQCIEPDEEKIIVGQGNSNDEENPAVTSRFKDPLDPANSLWYQDSVPRVRSQPWQYNYMDGECGIRNFSLYYAATDPDLDCLAPRSEACRGEEIPLPSNSNCSNIADNALHPTTPDLLVGRDQVVVTRRTKYVAISRLTDDFLDTSGILYTFEGELEAEADMMLLQAELGMFDWTVPETFAENGGMDGSTTFKRPVFSSDFKMAGDWDSRFYQYVTKPNDRSKYSLACALDGECPVNFASQVSDYADEQWLQNEAFFQEWRATYAST